MKEEVISDSNKLHKGMTKKVKRYCGMSDPEGISLRRWHFELWPEEQRASFAKIWVCVWVRGDRAFQAAGTASAESQVGT